MKLEGEQILFRIFLKAGEKYAHIVPLYRHLVKRLKEERIAGSTVVKGVSGFLVDKEVLKETFLKPHHVPVCIETVDRPEKINGFIEKEWEILKKLIMTTERAHVIVYTADRKDRQKIKSELSFIEGSKASKRDNVMWENRKEMVLVRTFIGDSDREKGGEKYLFEFIISEAKKRGFLLAFVYKGVMGYGKKAYLRDIETIEFSSNLPLCVELIGEEEKVKEMLDLLNEHVESGLITVEKVTVYNIEKKEAKDECDC